MTQAIRTAATVAAIMAFAGAFILAGAYGLSKTERIECLKWQAEAWQFAGYYLTSWQEAQCEARGIVIDAPIIK